MEQKNNYLGEYGFNVTSQNGEDGILEKIFKIIPPAKKWCVELGAWDGKYLSNCYNLITTHGWHAVMIEGNNRKFKELKHTYAGNERVLAVNQYVALEGSRSLDRCLAQSDIPADFELLSIDVDGADYHIWESLKKYRPRVVVIEYNFTIPDDIEFIQQRDIRVNHGNSLLALTNQGKQKGYKLVCITSCNAIFVDNAYYPMFGIADNSIRRLRSGDMECPRVMQLYDGTLMLSDEFDMVWKQGVHVGRFDLQKLPAALRHISDEAPGMFTRVFRKALWKVWTSVQGL